MSTQTHRYRELFEFPATPRNRPFKMYVTVSQHCDERIETRELTRRLAGAALSGGVLVRIDDNVEDAITAGASLPSVHRFGPFPFFPAIVRNLPHGKKATVNLFMKGMRRPVHVVVARERNELVVLTAYEVSTEYGWCADGLLRQREERRLRASVNGSLLSQARTQAKPAA